MSDDRSDIGKDSATLMRELARLREARDAWVKERAGHCREIARLREENETHKEAHEALLNHCENLGVDNFRQREELARLREEREAALEVAQLRVALERLTEQKGKLAGEYARLREYTRDLEQTAQRETADLMRENARLREDYRLYQAEMAAELARLQGEVDKWMDAALAFRTQRNTLLAALKNLAYVGANDYQDNLRRARAAIAEVEGEK